LNNTTTLVSADGPSILSSPTATVPFCTVIPHLGFEVRLAPAAPPGDDGASPGELRIYSDTGIEVTERLMPLHKGRVTVSVRNLISAFSAVEREMDIRKALAPVASVSSL